MIMALNSSWSLAHIASDIKMVALILDGRTTRHCWSRTFVRCIRNYSAIFVTNNVICHPKKWLSSYKWRTCIHIYCKKKMFQHSLPTKKTHWNKSDSLIHVLLNSCCFQRKLDSFNSSQITIEMNYLFHELEKVSLSPLNYF